jgi:hypothetical protein
MAPVQNSPLTPTELLNYSEQHLYHEITMLWKLADKFKQNPNGVGITATALLESYVIHLRNLIEFFYRRRAELKDYQKTDVVAEDFFDDAVNCSTPQMSAEMKTAQNRANKEVNHLTAGRQIGKGEDWKVVQLFEEIKAVATGFARRASRAKLHEKVTDFLLSSEEKTAFMLRELSPSTNTVSIVSTLSFTEWDWKRRAR